jgi:porin
VLRNRQRILGVLSMRGLPARGILRRARRASTLASAALALATSAVAQGDPPPGISPQPTIATSLPAGGDPLSMRRWLAEHGVTFGFVHTTELLSNVRGGIRRGTVFDAKLEAMVGIDFGRLAGFDGLNFYANGFQLHGSSGPNRSLIGGLNTISNIEALPTTRLSELWLEQQFLGGKAALRAGQLVSDTEFLVSQYFGFFISSDWPTNPKTNIPSGGPAYPLSTPGIRLKIDPTPQTTALLAVFNGDPAGQCGDDPERCNRHGLNFRVNDPPYVIGELQYRYNQQAAASGLAGGIRIGAWHHFDRFDDLRFDINGFSLADPLSVGIPRRLRGNDGVYAVFDQQLYRPPGGDANSGVLTFLRAAYSPPDRSLNDFYLDGGIIFAGMIASRPADAFGASFLYAHVSRQARALDRDTRFFTGVPIPLRDHELTLDFSYGATIVPGWVVQPNLQVVLHPGGNVAGNASPVEPVRNAVIVGVRSTMRY